MLSADCSSPSSSSKVLADAYGVITSPGAIWTKIGGAQIPVTRSQPIKKEVLGHPHLKTLAHIDCCTPGMFHADGIKGPCVKRMRNVPSEKKARLSKKHDAPQRASAKRTRLQQTREHVARKSGAGGVHPSEAARVGAANVGIDFVVRRRDIKLGVPPKSIGREEYTFGAALVGLLSLGTQRNQHHQKKAREAPHSASTQKIDSCSANFRLPKLSLRRLTARSE